MEDFVREEDFIVQNSNRISFNYKIRGKSVVDKSGVSISVHRIALPATNFNGTARWFLYSKIFVS